MKKAEVAIIDDRFVIRYRVVKDEVRVFVHRRDNGKEFEPVAYMLGSNALTFKLLKEDK